MMRYSLKIKIISLVSTLIFPALLWSATPIEEDKSALSKCTSLSRVDKREEALICYDALSGHARTKNIRALARYHALVLKTGAANKEALREFSELVVQIQDSPAAWRALTTLGALARELGPTELDGLRRKAQVYEKLLLQLNNPDILRRVAAEDKKNDEGEAPIFQVAGAFEFRVHVTLELTRLYCQRFDQPNDGLRILKLLLRGEDEESGLDDALLLAEARCYRVARRDADALKLYELFLDRYDSSLGSGAAPSSEIDQARFEQAELLFSLKRIDEAREVWLDLEDDIPTSRFADDALYRAGLISTQPLQCEIWKQLLEDYPESRFSKEVKAHCHL